MLLTARARQGSPTGVCQTPICNALPSPFLAGAAQPSCSQQGALLQYCLRAQAGKCW